MPKRHNKRAYPLRLEPKLIPKVWGGSRLSQIFNQPFSGPIGEAWLASTHPSAVSLIMNGPLRGHSIMDALEIWGIPKDSFFSLLIKIIESREPLSVQVHPNDTFARQLENQAQGKSEAWLILESEQGHVGLGFESLPLFPDLESAKPEEIINPIRKINVNSGDWLLVPGREIHFIGAGLMLLEVQQSSDVTYRIYDWNRSGRELHLHKANQIIQRNPSQKEDIFFPSPRKPDWRRNQWPFQANEISIDKSEQLIKFQKQAAAIIPLSGTGFIQCESGDEPIEPYQCWLIPPGIDFKIKSSQSMKVLVCSSHDFDEF